MTGGTPVFFLLGDVCENLVFLLMNLETVVNISIILHIIEKRQFDNSLDAIGRISKQLSVFIREHLSFFLGFDIVKVYYDNGQTEVNKILSSVLNALLDNVEFKRVLPKDYRLFQVADFICTLTIVRLKMEHKEMSRSEMTFFENERTLKKQYLKHLEEKELV